LDGENAEKLSAENQFNEYETLNCHGFVNIAETYNPTSIRNLGSRRQEEEEK
jgi:hypothetical protein